MWRKNRRQQGLFLQGNYSYQGYPIMEVGQEEVFGPPAPAIVADNEKEATKIPSDSKFGLSVKAFGLKF